MLSLQKYLTILSFLTLKMENVVTVEINLPSWFGSDMVKGFLKTNFTQLLLYSFITRYMQMSIDRLHFKGKIMDYTNLLLTMNDLKRRKHYKRTYSIFKQ